MLNIMDSVALPNEIPFPATPDGPSKDFFPPANRQLQSHCCICQRKFSAFGPRQHHCRFCGRSVCDLHSTKRRPSLSGLVRICDECEKALVGHTAAEEYRMNLFALREKLSATTSRISARNAELSDLLSPLHTLEQKQQLQETDHSQKASELAEKVAEEKRIVAAYTKILQSLGAAVQQSVSAETICAQAASEKAAVKTQLESEVEFLRRAIESGNQRAELLHSQAQKRIATASVEKLLCRTCNLRVSAQSCLSDRATTLQTSATSQLTPSNLPVARSCKADCQLF